LWTSPRFRWEINQAAPKVRNVNDPAAKANPMTYQIPVKAILARSATAARALDRLLVAGAPLGGRAGLLG
jgi:hypothetical protein